MAWLGKKLSHYCNGARHEQCDTRIYVPNIAGNLSLKGCCECGCHKGAKRKDNRQ